MMSDNFKVFKLEPSMRVTEGEVEAEVDMLKEAVSIVFELTAEGFEVSSYINRFQRNCNAYASAEYFSSEILAGMALDAMVLATAIKKEGGEFK